MGPGAAADRSDHVSPIRLHALPRLGALATVAFAAMSACVSGESVGSQRASGAGTTSGAGEGPTSPAMDASNGVSTTGGSASDSSGSTGAGGTGGIPRIDAAVPADFWDATGIPAAK